MTLIEATSISFQQLSRFVFMLRSGVFICLFSCCLLSLFSQPLTRHPVSTEAEINHAPCRDTIKILKRTEFYDIGVVLPSWQPIVSDTYVAVVEGSVTFNEQSGGNGPHVSHEDYPLYHYTHDLNFNLIPDKTSDNRYTNLLPLLVYNNNGTLDTALRSSIHVEWESGLGNYNKKHPYKSIMDRGQSIGFFSTGHERGDVIWNWPTIGDWVHVEGHYVWDRGHPPAKAEIHPARLVATKRQLPEKIVDDQGIPKYATRVDVYASGDGGAFNNNRSDAPQWVKRVKMSSKDYSFKLVSNLPRPSAKSKLKFLALTRNGHSFTAEEQVFTNDSSSSVELVIPWKSKDVSDLAVFAKTFYMYWDEGSGVANDYSINEYEIKLTELNFRKLSEKGGKAELRVFVNAGSDWLFLNDFFPVNGKILSRGMGKTNRHNWQLSNAIRLYVPSDKMFRVYAAGWEADGVDRLMGDLADQNMPCTPKTKRFFKRKMLNFAMVWGGCLDDEIGEVSKLHNNKDLLDFNFFKSSPTEGKNEDICPFSKYPLKDRYFLHYAIERMK